MDLDRTRELLVQLGLEHAAERVAELLTEAVKTEAPAHRFLDRLLEAEIREREALLIQGPPGVGKSYLGIALDVKAVENGFSVAFFRLENPLHALKKDAEVPPRRLRRKKYMNVALLIIDEMGFQPLTRQEAGLLFRLVSYR